MNRENMGGANHDALPIFFNRKGGNEMTKTLDELKQQVSLTEYVQQQGYELKRVGAGTHRINPCPVCGGNDHFTINENGNYFNSFSCEAGGSIVDWFIQVEGMEQNTAIDKLYSLAGEERPRQGETSSFRLNVEETKKTSDQPQSNAQPQPNTSELDYTDYITKAHEATFKNADLLKELREFAAERGVTASQITENKWAVRRWKETVNGEILEYYRVIIPIWRNDKVIWYTQRKWKAPETSEQQRFLNATGSDGKNAIFNYDYLEHKHNEPIFLTESTIDAMNLETLGYKAIAINSTTNFDSFIERFNKSKAKDAFLIGAFDSDTAGDKATKKLVDLGYMALKKPTIKTNSEGKDVTDINDWFMDSIKKAQEDAQGDLNDLGIKVSIDRQIALRGRTDNVESYLEFDFLSEIDALSTYKDKKTGFDNLDKKMNGLQAGLYVVGGVSSVGKTTFVHQLVDQLAERGDHIIYFSLEQTRLEMVTKSLARTMAELDFRNAYGSINIRKGKKTPLLTKAVEEYKKYAERVNIYEGNFKTNVVFMENYVKRYMAQNNVKPIVVVDYLQIMPPIDENFNDRGKIDENVKVLKALSSENKIPVFLISSFNRNSYQSPSTFESFKESGGIEYTADVMWALDFAIVHDEEFQKEKVAAVKNKLLNDFKEKQPRDIVLTCLKNRNGSLFKTRFTYHSNLDLYRPNEGLGDFRKSKEIGSDDTNINLDFNNTFGGARKSRNQPKPQFEEIDLGDGMVEVREKKKGF